MAEDDIYFAWMCALVGYAVGYVTAPAWQWLVMLVYDRRSRRING